MNKNIYTVLTAISMFLYSILGFTEEIVEKYLYTLLAVGNVGYSHDDFILNVSTYKYILIVVASVSIILAISNFVFNLKKKK